MSQITVRTVVRTVEITETYTVAPVPMPRPAPVAPPTPAPIAYTPKAGDRVVYVGPKGPACYKVVWVGTKKNSTTLRVKLVGFGGKVDFFADASKVRPA